VKPPRLRPAHPLPFADGDEAKVSAAETTYLEALVELAITGKRLARLRRANAKARGAALVIEGLLARLRMPTPRTEAEQLETLQRAARLLITGTGFRPRFAGTALADRPQEAEALELRIVRVLEGRHPAGDEDGVLDWAALAEHVEAWRASNDVDLLDDGKAPQERRAAMARRMSAVWEKATGKPRERAQVLAAACMAACGVPAPSRLQDRQRKRWDRQTTPKRRPTDKARGRP
jgi:hypothetical protein